MYQLNLHDEYLIFHWLFIPDSGTLNHFYGKGQGQAVRNCANTLLSSDLRLGLTWSRSGLHIYLRTRNIPRVSEGQQNIIHHSPSSSEYHHQPSPSEYHHDIKISPSEYHHDIRISPWYHHHDIIWLFFIIKEEDTGQPPPYPEAVLVMDIVGKKSYWLTVSCSRI